MPRLWIKLPPPGGALHTFWVRGRAIRKGIYFPETSIKNGIDFHNFGIRNGTDFQDSGLKYKVGCNFSKNWYKEVFEVLMARPRPKSGRVHPLG